MRSARRGSSAARRETARARSRAVGAAATVHETSARPRRTIGAAPPAARTTSYQSGEGSSGRPSSEAMRRQTTTRRRPRASATYSRWRSRSPASGVWSPSPSASRRPSGRKASSPREVRPPCSRPSTITRSASSVRAARRSQTRTRAAASSRTSTRARSSSPRSSSRERRRLQVGHVVEHAQHGAGGGEVDPLGRRDAARVEAVRGDDHAPHGLGQGDADIARRPQQLDRLQAAAEQLGDARLDARGLVDRPAAQATLDEVDAAARQARPGRSQVREQVAPDGVGVPREAHQVVEREAEGRAPDRGRPLHHVRDAGAAQRLGQLGPADRVAWGDDGDAPGVGAGPQRRRHVGDDEVGLGRPPAASRNVTLASSGSAGGVSTRSNRCRSSCSSRAGRWPVSGGISTIFEPSASRATEPLRAANAARPGSYGSVTTAPARSAIRRTTVSCACDRSSKPCTCSGVPSQADDLAGQQGAGFDAAARSVPRGELVEPRPPGCVEARQVLAGRVDRRRGLRTRRDRRAPSRAGRTAVRARRESRAGRRDADRAELHAGDQPGQLQPPASGRQHRPVGAGEPDGAVEHAVERHDQPAQQHAAVEQLALGPPERRQRSAPPAGRARLPRGWARCGDTAPPPSPRSRDRRSGRGTPAEDTSVEVAEGVVHAPPRLVVEGDGRRQPGRCVGRRRQTSTSPTASAMPARPTTSGTSQANNPDPSVGVVARMRSPNWATRASLTCCFVQPASRFWSMKSRIWFGGRRVRQVEPGAADRAHHLGLDLVPRELRCGGDRDGHGDESRAPTSASRRLTLARLRDGGAEPVGVDLAREPLDRAALAVDHERLGEAGDAEAVLLRAVAVVGLRVAEAEALRRRLRASSTHVVARRRRRTPRRPLTARRPWWRAAAPLPRTGRTRRPRS